MGTILVVSAVRATTPRAADVDAEGTRVPEVWQWPNPADWPLAWVVKRLPLPLRRMFPSVRRPHRSRV